MRFYVPIMCSPSHCSVGVGGAVVAAEWYYLSPFVLILLFLLLSFPQVYFSI